MSVCTLSHPLDCLEEHQHGLYGGVFLFRVFSGLWIPSLEGGLATCELNGGLVPTVLTLDRGEPQRDAKRDEALRDHHVPLPGSVHPLSFRTSPRSKRLSD